MQVLVVGLGAREHALVWKLAVSSEVGDIYCAPGNGGTAHLAQNLDLNIATESDCDQLAGWAFNNKIDLVIVGPELPLKLGLADSMLAFGVPVAGPTQAASRLEWSKAWAKDFMRRHGIPTPDYVVVEGVAAIRNKLNSAETVYPLVMKADGLAGGKGAVVARDVAEAEQALDRLLVTGALPSETEQARVVIEEYLDGFEVSALAFSDGTNVSIMPPVCDYKRLLDGDEGPLTGGMGAYTPTKRVTPELWEQIERDILARAVRGMAEDGAPYRGVLYAGLMLTDQGPKVLEFNCRFGDPEAQVLMMRLKTPLETIMAAIAGGDLTQAGPVEWSDQAAVGVVIASEGYPATEPPHRRVGGLEDIEDNVPVFHAGTSLEGDMPLNLIPDLPGVQPNILQTIFARKLRLTTGNLSTDHLSPKVTATGGRILTVVGTGETLQQARDVAYRNAAHIRMDGAQYRHDIASQD